MSFLTESLGLTQKYTDLAGKLQSAQGDLSPAQLGRFTAVAAKLAAAAMKFAQ